jgi:hypothetical protein
MPQQKIMEADERWLCILFGDAPNLEWCKSIGLNKKGVRFYGY